MANTSDSIREIFEGLESRDYVDVLRAEATAGWEPHSSDGSWPLKRTATLHKRETGDMKILIASTSVPGHLTPLLSIASILCVPETVGVNEIKIVRSHK